LSIVNCQLSIVFREEKVIWFSNEWKEYALLDAADGFRLEKWGDYTLVRPDPQVIWRGRNVSGWENADGIYERRGGGGGWRENTLPKEWDISYKNLQFRISPTSFKHTGLFPEQAANWDFIDDKIRSAGREISVLNLFAYTGGATVAAAAAGASVCHVDAARGMVEWAKINAEKSGLSDAPVRYIVDDCLKFAKREIRRGKKYDAIIMDPPSYGRGPNGETWKLEDAADEFVTVAAELLSDKPLFFFLNSYTTGLSPLTTEYILRLRLKQKAKFESGELALPVQSTGFALPCGGTVRVTFE
jgi:23S rRNA (cytosine1962-C5)-methyltransferase